MSLTGPAREIEVVPEEEPAEAPLFVPEEEPEKTPA